MTVPDPYARSLFRGKLGDNATIARLKQAEAKLGYELTIAQFIGGAQASAGTHLEGRAVDLAAWDHERKVRVLRDLGFAAWYRAPLPGVWGEHVHAVLIFESRTNSRGVADSGFRQIGSYDRGRNGLANDGIDSDPYRPDPKVTFTLAQYKATFAPARVPAPQPTNVSRIRDRLVEALHSTSAALALMEDVPEHRERVLAQRDEIVAARRQMKAVLEALPER